MQLIINQSQIYTHITDVVMLAVLCMPLKNMRILQNNLLTDYNVFITDKDKAKQQKYVTIFS